ncbi:DUF6680 family protein [Bradyrhizobium elkanii]|uniref:DUF6680 family protein n=1 Tax=Bradyrhizobium elkanii TaxID=29448 RepID=UPI003BA8723C
MAGPVVAVQTQKWIERASERGKRRQWIFTSLMANRATRLNDDYVRALNSIDLEFSPKRSSVGLLTKRSWTLGERCLANLRTGLLTITRTSI